MARAVRALNPGYFALVMATGILSLGLGDRGAHSLSAVLLVLAAAAYVVLVSLNLWRFARFRADVHADLADPRRGFALFTFVAATDVVGTRIASDGHRAVALALLLVGVLAWVLLGYLIPWTALLGRAERPILGDANGTWFIATVASQSVVALAATLEPDVHTGQRELAMLAVLAWSVGVFLYGGVALLVAARMLFHPLRPADLTPPYWVSMGATAITVLAGSRIVDMADTPIVDAIRGLVAGASVVFWAFGTWLIPPLLAAGFWRHVRHRVPLRYDATLWSIVFPLGMYGIGSYLIGQADGLPIVTSIGADELWVAFGVWVVTFVAMLQSLARLVPLPGRRR